MSIFDFGPKQPYLKEARDYFDVLDEEIALKKRKDVAFEKLLAAMKETGLKTYYDATRRILIEYT